MDRAWLCPGLARVMACVLVLAGCKPADMGGGVWLPDVTPGAPGSGTGAQSTGWDGETGGDVAVAASALARYFVQSFAPFEAAALRLRETDPRFLVQRNTWTNRDGRRLRSYPLASARVDYAHAVGLTGAGQTVAVVDSGFAAGHEVFRGVTLTFPVAGTRIDEHGTAVASIIAASSTTMTGVAPGASLMLSSFDTMTMLAEATRAATRAGAVAQNNSWGFLADAGQTEFRTILSGSDYLDALVDYAGSGVVIFAAPNDPARARATLMEALPVFVPDVEAGWLAVVNAVPDFDEAGVRSATLVSSPCLEAARWCLAADGAWVAAGEGAPDAYIFATGTSFAAPQVAGALAILAEAFPDLTPHELRARLLASADNGFFAHDGAVELAPGFFHGYSRAFGHGFLDLRAALLPIGTPQVPLPSGDTVAADRPLLRAGRASGDAALREIGTRAVVATDALGAGFRIGAGALIAQALPPPLMRDRLAGLAKDLDGAALPMQAETGALSLLPGRHLELAVPDGTLRMDVALAGDAGSDDFGAVVRAGRTGEGLSFGFGVLHDGSGALGMSAMEGGGGLWAATLDVEATVALGPATRLRVFGQAGIQEGAGRLGIAEAGASRFNALGADLSFGAVAEGGRVSLGVALPTALTAAPVRMTLPVGLRSGEVRYDAIGVDLAPQAREVRLSAGLATEIGGGWSVSAELVHARNRGHIAGRHDSGAVIGLSARF